MASTTVTSSLFFTLGVCVTSGLFHLIGNHGALKGELPSTAVARTTEAEADRIHHLPGSEDCCTSSFEKFSGYLSPTDSRHVFYLYVESQNDPENDPVVLWTNGGPGCSGLIGFGVEHGPYLVDSDGQVSPNPYSFNKVANMLYLEQPAGVGFSYADTPEDLNTGDAQAASDNYGVILEFLRRFPERQKNDFIVSSESYGGHYMPQLALEILKRNVDGKVNFQGIFVGNPYVDPFSNQLTMMDAYFGRGLVPQPDYKLFKENCYDPESYKSPECHKIYHKIGGDAGGGINPYALDYPVCIEEAAASFSVHKKSARRHLKLQSDTAHKAKSKKSATISSQAGVLLDHFLGGNPPFLPSQDVYKPCGQVDWQHYLRRADVQAALHVHPNATSGDPVNWSACGGVHYSHEDVGIPTIPLFETLVKMGVAGNHSLNILVLSGDDDSVCSTASTQFWIWDLGVNASHHYWKQWEVQGQTAGYLTHFDMMNRSNASFAFATVHGAGHEVPAYRPMEALELFRMFLTKDW